MNWKILKICLILAIWMKIMNWSVKKNKKVVVKFKTENPENIWIDEFVLWKVSVMLLNVEMTVKINWKVFLNPIRKILNLMNIKMFRWWRISTKMW